ncbi:MAG TPA: hypothetical protein VFG30_39570 [Polyangiales bacterium]|nr:hypothetical protein [Polyangiales bacterium]
MRRSIVSVLSWVVLVCACGSDTAGQSILVDWTVAKAADESKSFTTDTGWDVTLDEARVGLDSVFAIAPASDSKSAVAWLSELLVPVAHAHGGHDDANGLRVRAELLDPMVVDVLADAPTKFGDQPGEAGDIATIKIELARPGSDLPDSLHGFQAYARGVAEKAGVRIPFAGGLHIADAEPARRVETQVKFALSEGGALTLAVHADEWFRDAEFERLSEADGDADRQINADSQVGRAWAIGVRSPAAFDVTYKTQKD